MRSPQNEGLLSKFTAASLAVSMALTGVPAFAQSPAPSDIGDLLDARGSDGEFQIAIAWLHPASHLAKRWQCLQLLVAKQYQEVRARTHRRWSATSKSDTVGNADCNQKDADGMSTGAGVAVGAAVLLGIAALASKSHHREDRKLRRASDSRFRARLSRRPVPPSLQ
jgi:hypothetical protein